jgi:hypothetical protein
MDRPCFDCPQPGNCGYPCLEQQKQERRWPDGGCLCTGRTYFNEGLLHHEVPASQLEDVALHPYAEQELAKFREHFTIVSMAPGREAQAGASLARGLQRIRSGHQVNPEVR